MIFIYFADTVFMENYWRMKMNSNGHAMMNNRINSIAKYRLLVKKKLARHDLRVKVKNIKYSLERGEVMKLKIWNMGKRFFVSTEN